MSGLALAVRKEDNAMIHRKNHNPADSVVCFANTYPLHSDLSGGQHYPAFRFTTNLAAGLMAFLSLDIPSRGMRV